MNSGIEIVKLEPKDWQVYRDLRLRGLKEDSYAFGSSYEEEVDIPEEQWKSKLSGSFDTDRLFFLFAKDGDKLIGMVGAKGYLKKKINHIATIIGVYVAKESRGQGVGTLLMQAVLNELAKHKKIIKVDLGVSSDNPSALKLYEKLRFKMVGKGEKEFFIDGKYYDKYLMEKFIN